MNRLVTSLLATAALLLAGDAPAFAHAFLAHAAPAVGSSVQGSPPKLDLWYTEGVERAFCKVAVTAPHGQPVATGPLTQDPNDPAHLSVTLPRLAPGGYGVSWQVVATDSHRTTGSFTFTVAP
jgi:methionine-rich copper-binding protein CopC